MLYSTKDVRTANDKPAFIPPGIHENIKMTDVKYSETIKGNEFLAFYFEDKHGNTLSHTEWPVRATRPVTAMSEDERKKFEATIAMQMSRIKQIIETFLPRGSYDDIEANSFKDYSEKLIKLLGNKYKDVLLRVKVVYDRNNWTALARDANRQFIEPMSISKEDSKIQILDTDKMERSPLTRADNNEASPFRPKNDEVSDLVTETISEKSGEELPF